MSKQTLLLWLNGLWIIVLKRMLIRTVILRLLLLLLFWLSHFVQTDLLYSNNRHWLVVSYLFFCWMCVDLLIYLTFDKLLMLFCFFITCLFSTSRILIFYTIHKIIIVFSLITTTIYILRRIFLLFINKCIRKTCKFIYSFNLRINIILNQWSSFRSPILIASLIFLRFLDFFIILIFVNIDILKFLFCFFKNFRWIIYSLTTNPIFTIFFIYKTI